MNGFLEIPVPANDNSSARDTRQGELFSNRDAELLERLAADPRGLNRGPLIEGRLDQFMEYGHDFDGIC